MHIIVHFSSNFKTTQSRLTQQQHQNQRDWMHHTHTEWSTSTPQPRRQGPLMAQRLSQPGRRGTK